MAERAIGTMIAVTPGRRLKGCVVATLAAPAGGGEYDFVTAPVEALTSPRGHSWRPPRRPSAPFRQPRAVVSGTEMRNDRQLSLLAPGEPADTLCRASRLEPAALRQRSRDR
jgi:hypothetical protein